MLVESERDVHGPPSSGAAPGESQDHHPGSWRARPALHQRLESVLAGAEPTLSDDVFEGGEHGGEAARGGLVGGPRRWPAGLRRCLATRRRPPTWLQKL